MDMTTGPKRAGHVEKENETMKKSLFPLMLGLLGVAGLLVHPPQRVFGNTDQRVWRLSVAPGGSATFPLPVAQVPVHIAVSFSLLNGGTQVPSEIMYAVVNQDEKSSKFSWVGTNNDGSVQVGTSNRSGSNPLIARICGGGCPTTNATLEVGSDQTVPGTLKLTVNRATVSRTATFVVTMLY
jgi:hypothetical protein